MIASSVVFAKKDGHPDPFLFRSYSIPDGPTRGIHPYNPTEGTEVYIWEAARATSAALGYLKPIKIGDDEYEDGAIFCNDPTEQLFRDVKAHRGIHRDAVKPFTGSLILTLGTGSKKMEKVAQAAGHRLLNKFPRLMSRILSNARIAISHRRVRDAMADMAASQGYEYYAWDGGDKIGNFGLDDCEKFGEMEDEIKEYMEDEKQDELKEVARLLVEERRRRVENTPERWQRFAYCTILQCPHTPCHYKLKVLFRTKASLLAHVLELHGNMYRNPQEVVDKIDYIEPYHWGPWCLEDPDIEVT